MAIDSSRNSFWSHFFPALFSTFFHTQLPCTSIQFSYYYNSGGNSKNDGQVWAELPLKLILVHSGK